MALGTPTLKGSGYRTPSGTGNLNINFTSSNDELLICAVLIDGSSANAPDSLSGHNGTLGWTQIGSTEHRTIRFSLSLWAAVSSGATSTNLVIAEATSTIMSAIVVGITGADTSSIANAISLYDLLSGYGTTISHDLTGATQTTIHFWGIEASGPESGDIITEEAGHTELTTSEVIYSYNQRHFSADYHSTGDATPTATIPSNRSWISGGCQVNVATGGGGATAKNLTLLGVG